MTRSVCVISVVAMMASCCAEQPHAAAAPSLRVCADPNNLPFSNSRLEGFENRLAELVARDLGATVSYTWWAQRRGFFRNTLNAGVCDVVIGVPRGVELALTTRPYYRSTYVFVTRQDRKLRLQSFDDPRLRHLRIGVQLIGDDGANSPPAHALSRRGIIENVRGYSVYGDYSEANPPARIISAVARGDVDVALAWGPLAGYFAARQPVALDVVNIQPQIDPPALALAFEVSMAVRHGEEVRKARLDDIIAKRREEIDAMLADYHVPRVDRPPWRRPAPP